MRNSGLLGGAGLLLGFALLGSQPAALGGSQAPVRPAAGADAARPGAAAMRATVEQYCLGCHNDRVKSGGFALDPATLGNVGAHAAEWEKVVRKLRSQAMPPPGMPRPDPATYTALVTALEHDLDAADAASPPRGQLPPVRRLSRTEYANAVRDLLGLEALPREIDISYLLPQDNISSGFDNIAELLFMSPSTLERYLDAARKISRFAVGNPEMPVLVNIHRLDEEHPQDERVEELPFGTRGGTAVTSDFPVTGTYVVKVDLAGTAREPHELEISLDGERVHLRPIAQPDAAGAGGRRAPPPPALEFPIEVEAGRHLVGATFVQHSEARDEATLRPRMRSRGTQPAIASVTITGPQPGGRTADSPSRQRFFVCRPPAGATSTAERTCAANILSSLTRRAYRRPVTAQDVDELLPFYEAGRTERDFDLGIERALQRVLVSPHFLFRVEQSAAGANGERQLRPLDLASRLSFFLWSSIPDDELLGLAESGRLSEPAVLTQQVRRLAADPRAAAMVTNFAAQWLYLPDIAAKRPDEILFPDFDETLRAAMRRETELFVESIFRENRPVVELLTANYSFLNERLARHYGIPQVKGSHFRRVTFPEGSVRGGLLGQGSLLTITSYATRTSPVLRGKWVLENLLSAAPPPPPPDIPALKVEGPVPGEVLTVREAMTRHRASPVCASCHARMDPIGFAMENFDAIGKWRESDAGGAIDATGVFPDGSRFSGVDGLKRELLRHPEQFVETVAERLLMYALGRNVQYYDAPAVRGIVRRAAAESYTLPALAVAVVQSRPFLTPAGTPPDRTAGQRTDVARQARSH